METAGFTSDGKRVAFQKFLDHVNVYVATFKANGTRITEPTRLTSSEGWNFPQAWTHDSKAIIFYSNRDGHHQILKQALDEDAPELLASDPALAFGASLSPDGAWLISLGAPGGGEPSAPRQVMRFPITGGPPQSVLTVRRSIGGPSCARSPAGECIIGERTEDGKQVIISAFDPVKGRGSELAKTDFDPNFFAWDLSPDGSRLAVIKNHQGPIEIISLRGEASTDITVKGWSNFLDLDWAADGKGLLVSSSTQNGRVLLQVDLQGSAHVLWEQQGAYGFYGRPSPDGRHLAIPVWTRSDNIWTMEHF